MTTTAILDLNDAQSRQLAGTAADAKLNLRLEPGDFVLIDARDAELGCDFADLCSGLMPPDTGSVEFLGRDWTSLPLDYAQALRGRIGRVFARRSWIDFLDAATNIMLPQLHHTRRDPEKLRADATDLCRRFGLPGLPIGRINMLSAGDLVRAGFVRAFLGEPMLLLLESPLQGAYGDMIPMLLNGIAEARNRGAAAIWMTRNKAVWSDRSFPATQRLRLGYHGLTSLRTG